MNDRIKNQVNPFAQVDTDELRRLLVDLLPENDANPWTKSFQKEQLEAVFRARFSELPDDTYRILECGSFVGWYYKLEIGEKTYTLEHPAGGPGSEFKLYGDRDLAIKVAKKILGERVGLLKSEMAEFTFVFGFEL